MEFKNYVGAKIIKARYGTLAEYKYEKYQDKYEVKETDCVTFGYIVYYPNFSNNDLYCSWSPKDIFEKCYREISSQEINILNNQIKKDE